MSRSRNFKRIGLILIFLFGCQHVQLESQHGSPRGVASEANGLVCESSAENMVSRNGSRAVREECTVPGGKKVYLLKIKGTSEDIGYYHGYLLADLAAQGLISTVKEFVDRSLAASSKPDIARMLLQCFSRRVEESSSQEFNNLEFAFIRGFKEGLAYHHLRGWPDDEMQVLSVVTDSGIALDGFIRRLEMKDPRAFKDLVTCKLADIFQHNKMAHMPRMGGCTGFAVPAQYTNVGSMIHGRNLDGDMIEAFNQNPTLFLFDETASAPPGKKWYRYAGVATAGMFYPAGISGFNEAGLAVSLHEMQTTESRLEYKDKRGNMGPYLQQRILREAATIDEAFAIAQKAGTFTGWTIFVSDAVRGESASIELSGMRARLAKRVKDRPRAQTNHFYSPEMQDQFYNYNFNKYLETRARDRQVESILSGVTANSFGVQQAIDLLANHQDADVPGADIRSFGRTVVKAYTSLSTVALADPNVRQFWFSSGDRYPMPQSKFAGFQIDFDNLNFIPLGVLQTHQYDRIPNWDRSTDIYTRARLEHEHGRPESAVKMLDDAIRLSESDGKFEPAYHFFKARILMEMGEKANQHYGEAMREFDAILNHSQMLDRYGYLEALVNMYSVYASDKSTGAKLDGAQRDHRASASVEKLRKLYAQFKHFDLLPKIKLAEELAANKEKVDALPEIDSVVVDN